MPAVNEPAVHRLVAEIDGLRRENEALLRELENAYAQLTAVLQVSQDETRIAYSELQEKLVVQEKKLVELSFLSNVGEALLAEDELEHLRRAVVEKICLLVPVDLALLQLDDALETATCRERDLVREVHLEPARRAELDATARAFDADGVHAWVVADLDADPQAAALLLRPDARSAALLPLRAHGRRLGWLLLNSRLRANFRPDQEPLLGAFAHLAAAALAQALRVRWYREQFRRLQRHQGLCRDAVTGRGGEPSDTPFAAAMRGELGQHLLQDDITRAPARPAPTEEPS
jgi:transcriptional regulator with GAF, ATPase, and Fis domain